LFDEFVKDGKTSIGYRLVYQDKDRTLTDEEVNAYADKVYSALRDKGYEIR
jgi:phenylalanyl-tRNA synthetase beta subunit